MASKGVVAVELARVSVAGVFHFSIDENVSGEQSHLGAHVHPVDDLSDVAVLRLPWAEERGMFMRQRRRPFRDKAKENLSNSERLQLGRAAQRRS